MQCWQVGDVRITSIVEGVALTRAERLLPEASASDIQAIDWLVPQYADERGRLRVAVQALVVETPSLRVVVDTCIGNDKTNRDLPAWNQLQTSFLRDLEQAGVARQDVDTVLCTHLHADHVGWNTMLVEGSWRPTFPNARYLIGRSEYAYWKGRADMPEAVAMHADSLEPVFAAGLAELIDAPYTLCPEIALLPTPGHTPGHVSVRITSRSQEALISGDTIHHPCQLVHPHWFARPDFDRERAHDTRLALLERCTRDRVLLFGTHFAAPCAGRVERGARDGYRFVPYAPARRQNH